MTSSFQTYRTIKRTLAHALHIRRGSHRESPVNTLALLICGSVGSQHVQFAKVAQHMPICGRKDEYHIAIQETVASQLLGVPKADRILENSHPICLCSYIQLLSFRINLHNTGNMIGMAVMVLRPNDQVQPPRARCTRQL